ncbi:MAG: exopolysaccharide biosynthesis polyprenyl glycosylphosphotransferase [Brevundimonas sp.]|nr:MAG: exopolysaccharide biosynthesis polyprenyl glycosylphosphotransferase [Brevundimonas sp.]
MTEAALPAPKKPKKPKSGSVASLQALAAQAFDNAEFEESAARRGPFRPEIWLNARERGAARLAIHYFRAFDVLAVIGLTLLCAWAATPANLPQATVAHVAPFAAGGLVVLGLMRSMGLYRFETSIPTSLHLGHVAGVCATGTMVAMAVGLVNGIHANWPAYLIWGGLVLITLNALHMGWTDLVGRWRRAGVLTPNVVLVGATRHAEKLIREALRRRDINVLGIFDDRLARAPQAVEGVPVLGTADDLLTHRMTPYVDRIVLAIDPGAQARVRELNSRLRVLPNEVTLLVEPEGEAETNLALDRVAATPLASLDGPLNDDRRAFHKRIQDLIVGALALLLLLPVMALIAVAIKLDSPGPIFFRQRRHGFNHEEIVVWKFRSMRQETADATASRQVTADDDRVTRVGRFIRNTSLDELPQLLNVLAGEMSLVGPRPHAIGMKTGHTESARLVAEYAHRHRIKPGMTGWAAIHGSRGPLHTAQDVRRRVQLDVEYIERQSLWLDLWIMAVTVPVLVGDRAAVR